MSKPSTSKAVYFTTTIPYVNDRPHIGFALELIQVDFSARFYRLRGYDVFSSTGTDEHGQKIFQKAQKEGKDVQEYVDSYASEFRKLKDILHLSTDNFIRTTDPHHIEAAQEMWRRCHESGDIYKKQYKGLYCIGCELFYTEKDLVDGNCPLHPTYDIQEVEEENYFFKLSKYEDALIQYLSLDSAALPAFRREEALTFIRRGLEDFSISRLKERMPWGIPVPGDNGHVMYVWFEAFINYISTLGWPHNKEQFNKFWIDGRTIQYAGKDQIRFQSIMWQAMLMSAGLPRTDTVFYHGFITSEGQKMSKSIGNVIDPLKVVEEHGTDALRYYLLRHIHPTDDSDYTEEKFLEAYNGNLANGIGNLTSRIIRMAGNYDVEVSYEDPQHIWNSIENAEYVELIETFEFQKALDWLWEKVNELDKYIAEHEPYKVFKTDPQTARDQVGECLLKLWIIAVLLEPALPNTSMKMREYIQEKEVKDVLFVRK